MFSQDSSTKTLNKSSLYLISNRRSWLENIFYSLGLYTSNDSGRYCNSRLCGMIMTVNSGLKVVPSPQQFCLAWDQLGTDNTLAVCHVSSLPLESKSVPRVVNKLWMAPLAGLRYYLIRCVLSLPFCSWTVGSSSQDSVLAPQSFTGQAGETGEAGRTLDQS